MTTAQWTKILSNFYGECLEFWDRELSKQGHDARYIAYKSAQNAKQDLANLQHDPYRPQGERIPNKVHFNFMQTI